MLGSYIAAWFVIPGYPGRQTRLFLTQIQYCEFHTDTISAVYRHVYLHLYLHTRVDLDPTLRQVLDLTKFLLKN